LACSSRTPLCANSSCYAAGQGFQLPKNKSPDSKLDSFFVLSTLIRRAYSGGHFALVLNQKEKSPYDSMAAVQAEDDYNLQDAWDRVCMTFAQTTKVDLTTAPKYSVDEVLEQIRAKQDEDDEKNNKYKTAKDVIGKTLNFVMVLGGIAAQGASMASIHVTL
jgi:hypothetical protein